MHLWYWYRETSSPAVGGSTTTTAPMTSAVSSAMTGEDSRSGSGDTRRSEPPQNERPAASPTHRTINTGGGIVSLLPCPDLPLRRATDPRSEDDDERSDCSEDELHTSHRSPPPSSHQTPYHMTTYYHPTSQLLHHHHHHQLFQHRQYHRNTSTCDDMEGRV